MEKPTLFPWYGSKWLLAVFRNKVYLKGMKIQNIEDMQKWDDSTESYSTTEVPKMFPTVAASLG
jgi:hypothetical protein